MDNEPERSLDRWRLQLKNMQAFVEGLRNSKNDEERYAFIVDVMREYQLVSEFLKRRPTYDARSRPDLELKRTVAEEIKLLLDGEFGLGLRDLEESRRKIAHLAGHGSDIPGIVGKDVADPVPSRSPMDIVLAAADDAFVPKLADSISVIVDSDVDPNALAEFFADLSSIYSELSEGDELIIREGKVPVGEEVFA